MEIGCIILGLYPCKTAVFMLNFLQIFVFQLAISTPLHYSQSIMRKLFLEIPKILAIGLCEDVLDKY